MNFPLSPDLQQNHVPNRAYVGQFDRILSGQAWGWAYCATNPHDRVRIEIWADGAFLALGLADQHRADVEEAGFGDGYYGFQIPLPDSLQIGREYALEAKVAGAQGFLTGGPIMCRVPPAVIAAQIFGFKGSALHGQISAQEAWSGMLQLLIDGMIVSNFTLDHILPGDPRMFEIPLPLSVLDGRAAWVRLRNPATNAVLCDDAMLLPRISTPEAALQLHARQFRGSLSASVGLRHESLRQRMAIAGISGRGLTAQECQQLAHAYDSVLAGFASPDQYRPKLVFPHIDQPTISIVVPVHDHVEVTYNCLASLLLAPNKASFEVIIVDDASVDPTRDLARLLEGVTILRHEENIGFLRSCNRGAQVMRGAYLVLLNNDTEVCAGWLDELLAIFERFPQAGLAGAKLIYPDGRLQEAGAFICMDGCVNYGRGDNRHDPRYNYTREADYVSGAAIMLPRAVWEALGGFSEEFAPAYYEDTDLAMRVREAGLGVYYAAFSEVIHFEGLSHGTSLDHGIKRFQTVNEAKFRAKWAQALVQRPKIADCSKALDATAKLRILAIDSETPRPDGNAGGYAAVQEMRLLQSLGAKVTFVPANLAYLGHYTDALQKSGIECAYAPYVSSIAAFLAARGAEFDVVYITRYQMVELFIDAIRRFAPQARVMFCNADLHFLREIRAAIVAASPDSLGQALETRAAELEAIRRVDLTLTYTDAEAAVILSHSPESRVLRCPWVVEAGGSRTGFAGRTDIAFLGGFGHPPNVDAVEFFITELMPHLRKRLVGVRFRVFGTQMPETLRARACEDVIMEGYVRDVAEVYDTCRVFVAPLRSGAGIKGKVVGALAAGVPVVVSPVAAEGINVAHGRDAMVAESVAEWVGAICALYLDSGCWSAMSANATAFARSQFSFAAGQRRMRDALASLGVATVNGDRAGADEALDQDDAKQAASS
jgi:GT2 family glycosyltransferase/glycosyltransferase involved in cell wall biosynthesis